MRGEKLPMTQRFWSIVMCLVLASATVLVTRLEGQGAKPAPKGNPEARKLKNPIAATPESLAEGEKIFLKYCRFCHGQKGAGDSAMAPKGMTPPNLTDGVWDHGSSDGEIYTVIQEGIGPAFQMRGLKGKITEQDSWNLVNYVRSLSTASK